MVCKGYCLKPELIKKYNVVKSVSQKYRRTDENNFKLPDNWHCCSMCSKYYQGPIYCFCCGNKTRITARHKKTTEQQQQYRNKNMIEQTIKFKSNRYEIKDDILTNITKWEDMLNIKRSGISVNLDFVNK